MEGLRREVKGYGAMLEKWDLLSRNGRNDTRPNITANALLHRKA